MVGRSSIANIYFGFQDGEKVAKLLGVDCQDLYKNLLKPRIKVGNEFVTQGRNKDQVANSVGALCKGMFDRLFKWLVKKCNETLDTKQKRQHFIGVLDIAGFEIFDVSIWNGAIVGQIITNNTNITCLLTGLHLNLKNSNYLAIIKKSSLRVV